MHVNTEQLRETVKITTEPGAPGTRDQGHLVKAWIPAGILPRGQIEL